MLPFQVYTCKNSKIPRNLEPSTAPREQAPQCSGYSMKSKSEIRLCASSSLARVILEIPDGEDFCKRPS